MVHLLKALAARFQARAAGTEPTPELEPRLLPILARTHGLLIEEEQLAHMARVLAGFDSSQAESFRRALTGATHGTTGTSGPDDVTLHHERQRWRTLFVDGAMNQGLAPARAEAVYAALSEAAPRLADRADSVIRARQAMSVVREGLHRGRGSASIAQMSMPWIGTADSESTDSRHTGTYGS